MLATFTYSSVTATFRLRVTDHGRTAGAAVNVRHVPGGNTVVIDLGGPEETRLRGVATCSSTDEAALIQVRGQQGTLTYTEEPTGRAAILVGPVERIGYYPHGYRQVRVEFVLL